MVCYFQRVAIDGDGHICSVGDEREVLARQAGPPRGTVGSRKPQLQVGDGDEVLDRTMRPRIHHGGDRVNAHSRKDVRPDAVRWSGVLQVEGEWIVMELTNGAALHGTQQARAR